MNIVCYKLGRTRKTNTPTIVGMLFGTEGVAYMSEYVQENSHGVLDCVDGIFCWEELIHCNLFVFILFICQRSRNVMISPVTAVDL